MDKIKEKRLCMLEFGRGGIIKYSIALHRRELRLKCTEGAVEA